MPLMSTCLGRLGSRFSLILDPVRKQVHYGSLGLLCQEPAEMVVGLEDEHGRFEALPLSSEGEPFYVVDQQLTMTSVVYEAQSLGLGASLRVEIVAPFWPQDEKTSLVPAYIVNFRLERRKNVRWRHALPSATGKGTLRFGIKLPGAKIADTQRGMTDVEFTYPVRALTHSIDWHGQQEIEPMGDRKTSPDGKACDRVFPLEGQWRIRDGMLETDVNLGDEGETQEFSLALASHCGDALFERFGRSLPLKYTHLWKDIDAVEAYVRKNWRTLLKKSRQFDALWSQSALPAAAQDLTATTFQSYLMCTLWAQAGRTEWFSVWEGSCRFNSTVDVTYNEAMFYFACWPQLLELIFQEWSQHATDSPAEADRQAKRAAQGQPAHATEFPGRVIQHDMGAGWMASGQTYPHLMPVEENANFLLLLYAHGKWWGREKLFGQYNQLSKDLVTYLLWTDSKGNGFPDRGTANTIDDATPAVQYGRDNVYLGIKRLGALHAAAGMFEALGEGDWARRCRAAVRTGIRTLNANWLGDHWGVCLDKSARGLLDAWTHKPLPYRTLPGWDAYSLYTTNGLLPLMMVDDLPPGLSPQRLRTDVLEACRASMTTYGCGHSSLDKRNMWVSMNLWRDCAAGYLGLNLLDNSQRYWNQQVFANGLGSEKPNCFTETSLTNNLVWYPRGAASFGLPLALTQLICQGPGKATLAPLAPGRWPLLPLADWKHGKVPFAVVESDSAGRLKTRIEGNSSKREI